ncbi:MAG: flagellar type III secretion system pore protein FliP [Pseudomonadota bacterium]
MKIKSLLATAFLLTILLLPQVSAAANFPIPTFKMGVGEAEGPEDVAVVLQILALLTVLSLAPSIMVLMTCFTRLIIVFQFLRQAIGTQQSPPNQVLAGLALFMTFFIMTPVWQQINQEALAPYLAEEITFADAFEKAKAPMQKFMMANTREKDLALFISAAGKTRPQNRSEVSLLTLIPAFVISELKTAFIIGFVLYIPFLVIDMVVASVLLSMGMMMLPPVMISLPFKLMLFVLVDGWHLVTGSLIQSFGVVP